MIDVAVIGGGVIGGLILRELTKYKLKVCLLEGGSDVAIGQSSANSGIVHAGFDAVENSLKAKFNVLGNAMMKDVAKQLGVEYINNGSLVVAFSEEDLQTLEILKQRGETNGVKGLEIISRQKLFDMEKNISPNALGALYAPTGGIICPYKLTISAIGNAMDNGAQLYYNFFVDKIVKKEEGFDIYSKNKKVSAKVVINCAGINGGMIAKLIGDNIKISGRKGEYILLDKESGDFCKHTLFFTPTIKGKGILVSPTVDGNILLGPTAEEVQDGNTQTTTKGLNEVISMTNKMCVSVPLYNTITSFAGTRAYSDKQDFIIEESANAKGFINCVGIESPGLTSAPAIAKYVVEELVSTIIDIEKNPKFNGERTPDNFFSKLGQKEKNQIIKKDSRYGKIVCRCSQITEGEIVRAIHTNPQAKTVDAIKRRLRVGMGRCQGGFCQVSVTEILSRELNIPMERVTKNGGKSYILTGRTK